MSSSWFKLSAEEVYKRESVEWKRRALAAEGKLAGYRRLRENAEAVLSAVCERNARAKADSIDAMAEELACIDVVDAPRDIFLQTIELGENQKLEVRLKVGIGVSSRLEPETGIIEVEALQPNEGRVIGLFFQVLQYADIAVSVAMGTPTKLDADYLHGLSPMLLALCVELGLLSPQLNVTGASLEAHLRMMHDLELEKDAASPTE